MYKTAYNTTDSPVPADDLGHVIGGHEWGTIQTTDDVAGRALEDGRLVIVDPPKSGDLDPQAQTAFERTKALSERASRFDTLDREELFAVAVDAGVHDAEDDLPYKSELVARLAANEAIDAPEKQSSRRTDKAKTEES